MNKFLLISIFLLFGYITFGQANYQSVGYQKVKVNDTDFSQYIDNQVGVIISDGKPYRVKFNEDFSYSYDYIENSKSVTDDIHAFDLDRDGIKDMLTYPNSGVLSTYINRSEYFDDVYQYFNFNTSSFTDQDFDGDGIDELIINGRVYKRLEDGTIEVIHNRLPSNDYNYDNPFVYDVDGDGTNEIVFELVNNLGYLKLDDEGRLRQNLFTQYNETSTWMNYIHTNNGIQCIFYSAGEQRIKRLNIENGVTSIDTLVEGQPNYSFNTLRADLNNNGNQELIIYNRSADRQFLLSYDDENDEFTYRQLGLTAPGGLMYIDDMDDQPVLAAVSPTGMSFYQFDHDLDATLLITQTTTFDINDYSFVDIDGDGYTDVWNPNNIRHYYGGQDFGSPNPFSLPGTGGELIDFDEDGDADYVLDSVWYRNEGNLQFSNGLSNPEYNPYPDPEIFFTKLIYEGDIDEDGDVDILTYNFFGEPFELLENNNNESFNDPITLGTSDLISGTLMQVSVEDYNNDGLKDILMIAASGMVYWQQTGDLSFAPGVTLFEGVDRPSGFDITDGDGDGILDIVLGTGRIVTASAFGKTLLYKGSVDGPQLISEIEDNTGYKYPKFIHHDEDGAMDIIVSDGNDLYVYDYNIYVDGFTPKKIIYDDYDQYGDYLVDDVDSDGDDDIILYDDGTIAFQYLLKNEDLVTDICPKNDLYLQTSSDLEFYSQYFEGCKVIDGNVFIGGTSDWSDISQITALNGIDTIRGNLTMQYLNSMSQSSNPFPNLDDIGGNLYLNIVRNIPNSGFASLDNIGGSLTLNNMTSSAWSEETFPSLEHIGGSIGFSIADVSSLKPLINGSKIHGDLKIDDTWYDALFSLEELLQVDTIIGELHIGSNLQSTIDETENIKYFGGISIGGEQVKTIKLTSQQDSIPGSYVLRTFGSNTKIIHDNKIKYVGGSFSVYADTIPIYSDLISTGDFSVNSKEITPENFNKLEETVNFNFSLSTSHDYSNFEKLKKVKAAFNCSRNARSFEGLDLLDTIYQGFNIYNNEYLTHINSLKNNIYIGGEWTMFNNPNLNFCDIPALCTHIEAGRGYYIYGNASGCDDISDIACLENSIDGFTFYDYNKNGNYESETDALLANIHLNFEGEQASAVTSDNGYYRKFLLPGQDFSVEATVPSHFNLTTPNSYQIDSFIPDVTSLENFDFGFFTENETPEFASNITSSLFICNREFDVNIDLKNLSHTVENGYLEVRYAPEFTLDPMYQDYTTHDEEMQLLRYDISELYPYFDWEVNIPFIAPSADELDNEDMNIQIRYFDENGASPEVAHENDLTFGLLCSYDPNDKLVSSTDKSGRIRVGRSGDELIYTIRFQNTGNFYAEDVRITDEIASNLDLSTFTYLDASHDVEISMSNRTVTFMFDEIFLIDSTNSFTESQGYVTFSIKPISFELGEEFENDADIFFDFNDPILTNNILSEVYDPTVAVINLKDNDFSVYPQPAQNKIFLNSDGYNITNQPYVIKNMYGSTLKAGHIGSDSIINVNSLPSGVYVMTIGDRNPISKLISIVK